MKTPRWIIATLAIAPVVFVAGILLVLLTNKIGETVGVFVAVGAFSGLVIALGRLQKVVEARRQG